MKLLSIVPLAYPRRCGYIIWTSYGGAQAYDHRCDCEATRGVLRDGRPQPRCEWHLAAERSGGSERGGRP